MDDQTNPTPPAGSDANPPAQPSADATTSANASQETADAVPQADGIPAVGDHVIERRSFGRESADVPPVTTVITTRDSLAAPLTDGAAQ